MHGLSDAELLARTPAAPEAFGVFYGRYEGLVLGYFMRRTGNPELAADLAAETFAAALLHVRRFDPARGSAQAWLFGIGQKKLLRARRDGVVGDRARRRLGLDVQTLEDEALERVSRLGGDGRVAELLRRLPESQAAAVRARVIDERSYVAIAAEIRCSESVVRQRVSRGLASLRSFIEEA